VCGFQNTFFVQFLLVLIFHLGLLEGSLIENPPLDLLPDIVEHVLDIYVVFGTHLEKRQTLHLGK
jgi:hypothetical protein